MGMESVQPRASLYSVFWLLIFGLPEHCAATGDGGGRGAPTIP